MQKGARIHKPDYALLITVFIIVIYGLVMLASASAVISFEKFGDSNYLLKHQLLYGIVIGIIGFLIVSRLDYHVWRKFAFPLLALNLLLLLAVFIPGIGYEYGGARRWIDLDPTILQPTELLKLTFILYLSTLFAKNIEGIKDAAYGLKPFLIIVGSIVFLIMLQPDMGTMVIIAITAFIIFYVAGAPLKHLVWILMGASGLFLFCSVIMFKPYSSLGLQEVVIVISHVPESFQG